MKRAVAVRLGFDPFAAPAATSALIAELEGDEAGFRAVIRWAEPRADGEARRELRAPGPGCDELAAATALALSIAIDPLAAQPAPAPRVADAPGRAVAPPASTAPTAPAVTARAVAPARPRPAPTSWQAVAGVIGGFGVAPEPSPGVALGIAARRGRASLDLRIQLFGATSVAVGDGRVSGAPLFATLAPCVRFGPLGACGLASAGVFRGRGHPALEQTQSATLPYAAVGARLLGDVPLGGPVALQIHADLHLALARTTLTVSGTDAWSLPPSSVTVGAAGVLRF
jgi:hypothetical protein